MKFNMLSKNFLWFKISVYFFVIKSLFFSQSFYCQSSGVQPSPLLGKNSILFDSKTNSFKFYLDSILCYEYSILPGETKNGGTFNVLRAYAENGTSFLPSNFGGICASFNDTYVYPYDQDVSFSCLGHQILTGDAIVAYWKMKYKNTDSIQYKFNFKITGRTLTIRVEIDSEYSNNAVSLSLDRCEDAENPAAVAVPYIPLFYILYANNIFTSFYTDWNLTNASQIYPLSGAKYSKSSVRYAQTIQYNEKTNGERNRLNETLYLTTSLNIEDVFPNVPNPVSEYKQECTNWILWDFRPRFDQLVSPSPQRFMEKLHSAGVENIWLQIHNWQANHGADASYMSYSGYDDGLPCVLPANKFYGGNSKLDSVISEARNFGYRAGLHENYVDYYLNSVNCSTGPGFSESDIAIKSGNERVKAYKNSFHKEDQSFLLKPSRAEFYADSWSKLIQNAFPELNGSYLDVHSSVNPGDRIDYDFQVPDAGKFYGTMQDYRNLYAVLRKNHHGPIQGEGGMQILYQGYCDDFEARLITPSFYAPGYNIPILVDFDMHKLRNKAFVHGVGYYPFFYNEDVPRLLPATKSIVLSYIATELAFGHGGYLPTPELSYDIIEHAQLEYKYVFSIQKDFADGNPVQILYNDVGSLKTASEYIRSHPETYGDISSPDFMGQVMVIYNNGIIVCVNRNPFRKWQVNIGKPNGWFDYNANDSLDTGKSPATIFTLPPKNGWVVYDPLKNL